MNYYEVYDRYSDELLAKGTARECRKILGFASVDGFYCTVRRARNGISNKYRVVVMKGGETDYPVLGKNNMIHRTEEERNARKGSMCEHMVEVIDKEAIEND